MCGLVGYIGLPGASVDKAFKDLLAIDTIRGYHSSGALFVRASDSKCFIVKDVLMGVDLIFTKAFSDQIVSSNRVLMGHNRAATKGKVTKKNAHPFHCGSIVGAHNGTLWSVHNIDGQKFDTDSEAIFQFIQKKGIKEAWDKINGPAAISFWDMNDGTLNLIRNNDRPLFYAPLKEAKGVFWGSEPWMLHGAASRNQIELEKIINLPINTLASFSYNNGTVELVEIGLEPPRPFVYPTEGVYSDIGNAYNVVNLTKIDRKEEKKQRKLLALPSKTNQKMQCMLCYCSVNPNAKDGSIMIDANLFVCKTCNDEEVQEIADADQLMRDIHLYRGGM